MRLDGGAAIVTGAAGGIGSVLAAHLGARGMSVVLTDIDHERLEATSRRLAAEVPGGRFVAVPGDVGDPDHHDELVGVARSLEGGLRLSVLNAGVSVPGLAWEMPIETWELTTRVNYWGVVHGLRAALGEFGAGRPDRKEREGWVVAVSSGAGLVATPGLAPYVATKHAVVGLMESTHHELARLGAAAGVSVVCPGNIATDMPTRHGSTVGDASDDADGVEPADGDPVAGDPADGSTAREVVAGIEAAVREGVRAGADPSSVAEAIVEGVAAGRFWILPQPEIAWAASDRVRRIAQGEPPVDLLG